MCPSNAYMWIKAKMLEYAFFVKKSTQNKITFYDFIIFGVSFVVIFFSSHDKQACATFSQRIYVASFFLAKHIRFAFTF